MANLSLKALEPLVGSDEEMGSAQADEDMSDAGSDGSDGLADMADGDDQVLPTGKPCK